MRARLFGTLIMLVAAQPEAAQEVHASIEGVVRDATGGVLAAAAVEVQGQAGLRLSAVSDEAGRYRFAALPPGRYDVTARFAGLLPGRVADVTLTLGKLLIVDITLRAALAEEEIHVTGEAPLLDVTQSAASASIRDEFVTKVPRGRDFASLVTQAPGVMNDARLGGMGIDGASGADNRFILDGLDVTHLQTGTAGKGLLADVVDEVQVKSSGFAAEHGGATGGVVNVVTRNGTNELHGEVGSYLSASFLDAPPRKTLRISPTDDRQAEYVTYPKEEYTRWEPAFALGGPVARDRLWFFASYVPSLESTPRTVTFLSNGETREFVQKQQTHFATATLLAQLGTRWSGKLALHTNLSTRDGVLPSADGSGDPATDYGVFDERKPNVSLSGHVDFVASDRLHFGVRGGWLRYDKIVTGNPDVVRFRFERTNAEIAGVSPDLVRARGFHNVPDNTGTPRDVQSRLDLQLEGSYHASFAGRHALKAGIQFTRIGNDVFSGFQKQNVRFYWGETLSTSDGRQVTGRYGYFRAYYFGTFGDIHSDTTALFFQDSWTTGRLTLNLGMRAERENVPSFSDDPRVPDPAIRFGFAGKLAPRLGAAYDLKGDGRWKLYGSWGLFYDVTKLEMPRGLFGGDQWRDHYYTLDSLDWPNVGSNPECPPRCAGGELIEVIDRRLPSNHPEHSTIDPDLQPMRARELVLGIQHQLGRASVAGLRYVRKRIDRAVEDQGIVVPAVGEVFFITNPGFGMGRSLIPGLPDQPRAVRDYDALEADLRLRRGRLSAHVAYTLSRLFGNYSGLANSDENGRTSPNVNRAFDALQLSFDQERRGVLGRLPTDRPHQLGAQAVYELGSGTSLGASFSIASGFPISRAVSLSPQIEPVYYLGRGSDGRLPVLSQTDLYVQHEVKLGGQARLQLSANITNLFNQKTATGRFFRENQTDLPITAEQYLAPNLPTVDVQQVLAGPGILRDPRFLNDDAFQGPRSVRFGLKVVF